MKLRDLIAELQAILDMHPDADVFHADDDYQDRIPCIEVFTLTDESIEVSIYGKFGPK